MPAGHDDQILAAVLLIDHRVGLTACRKDVRPHRLARLDVDGADQVVRRRGDEDQPARRHRRAAVVRRADLQRQHGGDAERSVLPRRAEGAVPQGAAALQVDGAHPAIGRLFAQQAGELDSPARIDVDGVGHAHLRVARAFRLGFRQAAATVRRSLLAFDIAGIIAREPAQTVRLGAGHQAIVVGHVVVVRHDHAARRINRHAAPVRTAVVARILNPMAVRRRRGEIAVIGRLTELDAADHLVDGRHTPHITLGEVGLPQRVEQGEGLGRAALRRLDAALGHATLLDLVQRLAGATIQNVEVALFGRQDHRRNHGSVDRHVDQGRLRAQIIIPDILAHRLEMPARLARGHVQRDQ